MTRPAVVWLRDDLRLDDQPAIHAAAGRACLYVYIYDDSPSRSRSLGGASRWWLAHSLEAFARAIASRGGRLDIVTGPADDVLLDVVRASGADEVFWTRRYGGAEVGVDKRVKAALGEMGVAARSFNGALMREPWEVVSEAGAAFKVFTPFWRRHRSLGPPPAPVSAPKRLGDAPWPDGAPRRAKVADLGLTPTKPDWSGGLAKRWRPGEQGAHQRLAHFVAHGLVDYADKRDRPDGEHTSMLSPHLRFGEISPRRIAATIESAAAGGAPTRDGEKYLAELGWRDFSYSLLFGFPELATEAWQPRFAEFPYRHDPIAFGAWTRGQTGYPIVDAGMRELWATGYVHNRVRMIAASFLIKHLGIDWREGEKWFWDTLCDADPANNPASWQWVAGSGADAAPYFRIFNPVLQGQKFDADGTYVRRWVPELAGVDALDIHAPWLGRPGSKSGGDYPEPIVDHAFARQRALQALAAIKR
jgi:deoxyribodipyrimidine photo-lyase